MPYDQQSDLQSNIIKEMFSRKDVIYNLEIIGEQSCKHTDQLCIILEKQRKQKDDIESLLEQQEETQEDIAEEEEKQTVTMEDIGTPVAGFKTLMYAYMGIMAAISVLGITRHAKTLNNTTANTHASCRGEKAKHV